ncbi:MAG TPA: ABC transporter permease [Bryobacteraceae bacterium]|nr:ABC transporter permease [Bryobacteraceae bacterium]
MRYAFRVLMKNPGFTLAAAITLALGIGANTAIFSVLNAMLLHAMPYRDPQHLVMVWDANPALDSLVADRVQTCLQNFVEWRDQNRVFDGIAFFRYLSFDITGGDKPEEVNAAGISPGFFDVLGTPGMLGRTFAAQESEPGRNRVVILSQGLYQRRFGGNPRIIGHTIVLNGANYTVVGVLPREFHLPSLRGGMEEFKPEVWVPADVDPKHAGPVLTARGLYTFARLKPGVSIARARADMAVIARRLEEKYPRLDRTWRASVFPISAEDMGPDMHRTLLVLECAVAFVLLIACANVINLQLTRAAAREKEMAVRAALGANRWRMARQMLGESLLLSALGGGAGILLAHWAVAGMVSLAPADLHHIQDLQIDGGVLLFTVLVTILTGVLFGLAPAILAARQDPNAALRRGGRAGEGGISARIRRALVVAEVALSLVLLAGAGLMIRSLSSVLRISPGFRSDHLLTMQIDLRSDRYTKPEQGGAFVKELLERVSKLPGVLSAAVVNDLPMERIQMAPLHVEGQPVPPPGQALVADYREVTESYITTMGMRLTAGRNFTRAEAEKQNPTEVIVNESLARRLWPREDPLQKVLDSGYDLGAGRTPWRRVVVGVVADTRQLGLDSPPRSEMFIPSRSQFPRLALIVRTAGDPMRTASAVTAQVWGIDKDQSVHDVQGMDHVVDDTISQRRFNMLLLAVFAATALVMAAVGIYGVLAYAVSRRTQEIGIRMALGAQTGDVLRLVGREGLVLAAAGIAVGLAGALVLTRLMSSLLFGVSPTDPITFAAVPATLAAVALAACYLPARRAARVDPTVALKYD